MLPQDDVPKYVNKNDYGQISSGHIIPFGDSQDIILFHFIVHCDLSNPTVCKFIVNRRILLYNDYCGQKFLFNCYPFTVLFSHVLESWNSTNTRNLWLGMPEPLPETGVSTNEKPRKIYTLTD